MRGLLAKPSASAARSRPERLYNCNLSYEVIEMASTEEPSGRKGSQQSSEQAQSGATSGQQAGYQDASRNAGSVGSSSAVNNPGQGGGNSGTAAQVSQRSTQRAPTRAIPAQRGAYSRLGASVPALLSSSPFSLIRRMTDDMDR